MAVSPLQLPGYAAPQTIDWSGLDKLGTILEDNQKRMTLADLGKGLADGTIDYRAAAGKLASTGNLTGTLSLLQLAEAKDKLAREQAASNTFTTSLASLYGGTPTSTAQPSVAPGGGATVPNDSNAMPGTVGMNLKLADRTQDFIQDNPGTSLSSGVRTPQQQAALYVSRANNPNPVAPPGSSLHETGNAADIAGMTPDQRAMLPQYGLAQPVANDAPHVELAPAQGGGPSAAPAPATVAGVSSALSPRAVQLIGAMANPNLPAAQKEVAKTLLATELDQSKLPDQVKQYVFAKSQDPSIGSFTDWTRANKAAGGTRVSVDNGTIPPGYRANRDENGRIISIEPLPGSPAAQKQKDADNKAKLAEDQKGRYADVVTQDIDRAAKVIDTATLPTTGLLGDKLRNVGGTSAHDLDALLTTIRSNIGFDRLQAMRAASPTGGALGQVSDFENRQLQATLGNLAQSQTKGQLKENLNRVYNTYLDIVHGPGNGPPRRPVGGKIPPPSVGALQGGYRFKGGDPADRNNWVKAQ